VRRGRHKLANTFRGWQRSAGTETSRQKINGGSRLLCPAAVRATLPLPSLVLICMRRLLKSNIGGCEGRATGRASLSGKAAFVLASRMAGTALVFVLHVFFARWAGPEGLRRIRLRDNLRDARETVRLARLPAGGAALPAFLPGPERLVANARPRARRRTPHADDGRHCHRAGPPRASTARRWKVWMHRRGASELHLRPSIVSALKPLPESRGTHA
jgi:hypothetical protein